MTEEKLDRFGRKRNPKRTILVVALAAVAAAAGLVEYFYHPLKIRPGAGVVVGDFENTTNDPVFDAGLRELVMAELGQTPFLKVATDEDVGGAMHEFLQAPDAVLTPEKTREACERLNAAEMVTGSIELSEDGYAMALKMVDCRTGELVDEQEITSSDKDHVIDAIAKATEEMRENLGEPGKSLKKYEERPEMLTTQSLVALKQYGMGRRAEAFRQDAVTAESYYQEALALDGGFALAKAGLARVAAGNSEAQKVEK